MIANSTAESSTPSLRLRTLGAAELERRLKDGSYERVLGPGKPLALLAYLAFAAHHTVRREHLADLLWSNVNSERARNTLRQTLSSLRSVLGPDSLTAHEDVVTLALDLDSDAAAFTRAVRDGRHDEAAEMYGGPFLEPLVLRGGDAFERWALAEGQRLRDGYLLALESLARAHAGHGRSREAEPFARRLRDEDPLRQSGWRVLIEALLSQDRRAEARVEADALERLALEEACALEPETRSVIRRARAMAAAPAKESAWPASGLTGRDVQFALLLQHWAGAAARASVLEVVGAAGLGKTRLLRDVQRELAARGGHAVFLSALHLTPEMPFALVAGVARALGAMRGAAGISPESARVLVGLEPTLGAVYAAAPQPHPDPAQRVSDTATALLDLLRAVSDEQPVALLIDDIHRADAESHAVLAAAFAQLDREHVLALVARPPSEPMLAASAGEHVVELLPLDRAQVASLVASLASPAALPEPERIVAALHAGSGGSPGLVLDVLRRAMDAGALRVTNGEWRCSDASALVEFALVGGMCRRRLGELHPNESRVLRILAVAGRPLTVPAVGAATGLQTEVAEALIAPLVDERLIARREAAVEIAHPALGEFVLQRAAPEERRDAQRRLKRALLAARTLRRAAPRAAAAALVLLGVAAYALWPRPSRLVLAVTPLAGNDAVGLVPVPVVEVQDQYGRLMTSARDSVQVRVASGPARLSGRTVVVASGGRAAFPDLRFHQDSGVTALVFTAAGLPPLRMALGNTTPAAVGLYLVRAVVNGQVISPPLSVVRAQPGDSLAGTATLRYDSEWAAASVMLGLVPTWGNHETDFVTLGPLVTPAHGMVRHVAFRVRAPVAPGCHALVFVLQAEGSVGEIASGTNWTVGRLLWHRGNDVADWSAEQLAAAESIGRVNAPYLRLVNGRIERVRHYVGAAVMRVEVAGSTGAPAASCETPAPTLSVQAARASE